MTEQEQLKAIAKLDGQDPRPITQATPLPDYLTSRDAIVPVVHKAWFGNSKEFMNGIDFGKELKAVLCKPGPDQRGLSRCCSEHDMIAAVCATPVQLCEALLRATGKWKD